MAVGVLRLALTELRDRLISDAVISSLVGENIYIAHIADISSPETSDDTGPDYPLITLFSQEGNHAVWAIKTLERAIVTFGFHSLNSLEEVHTLYERYLELVPRKKTQIGNDTVCFHELREVWSNSGIKDQLTQSWILSSRLQIRASLRD